MIRKDRLEQQDAGGMFNEFRSAQVGNTKYAHDLHLDAQELDSRPSSCVMNLNTAFAYQLETS